MARTKTKRCEVCGKRCGRTRAYCYVLHEKEIRSRQRPRVKTLDDVYDETGRMRGEFIHTDVEEKLMARQRRLAIDASLWSDNGYVPPRNVSNMLNGDVAYWHVAHRRPWAVYVVTKEGKRKRKKFNDLLEAVKFHSKVVEKFPKSGVVSLNKSYDLPPKYRLSKEKLPKSVKWCVHCATFRRFVRVHPHVEFEAEVKRWSDTKQKYEWTTRTLALFECEICGHNNRDPVYRRANLPWEKRKIKPGVKRVKPRVRTKRGMEARRRKRR